MPIPAAHREFTVKAGGEVVPREHHLLAVSIVKTMNKIAAARLVYLDGSAAASDFPLSNADTFVPGTTVEILAGPGNDAVRLFRGIVVRQSLKVRDKSAPQLIVDCRHAAFKMAVGQKNATFFDQTDADVVSALVEGAGLTADVESTNVMHSQLVQFRATDWDFLLARAEANGKVAMTLDDKIVVKAPSDSGEPVATLQFGATILELDAQIDARRQLAAVKGVTWDPAQQTVVEREAADPAVTGPGNLESDDLAAVAGLDAYELRHASLAEDEAQAWADAAWRRTRFDKVSGRVKCEGIATVNPGDVIELAGIGQRCNGKVFVTGVRHDADTVQGWKTHIQFGGMDRTPRAASRGALAPLVPTVSGLQVGTVVSNEDPDSEHRVRVRLLMVDEGDGVWARVSTPDAGQERGFFFRPEIGDEVVVGFLDDDPRRPVIMGMLHSSAKAAPLQASDDNHEKVYQSRSKMRLYFNDDKKVVLLETPAGNRITLSEDDKAVTIEDQNGNKVELNQDGITIESPKAVQIKAGTEMKLESSTSFEAKGSDLKLEGSGAAELSSGATTSVKGGIVRLN